MHQWAFFRRVRSFRFDWAVDMKTGDRGAILAWLSGARERVSLYAWDGRLWRNRVFNRLLCPAQSPGRHMAEHYLSILQEIGVTTAHTRPEYRVPERRIREAVALLAREGVPADRPRIALQPFSLWPYKEWSMEKYAGLVRWLAGRGYAVLITGSSDERARAAELTRRGPGAWNLAGKTSLGVLAALFQGCRAYIGVDSAGMHIAAAAGIPTIAFFGPSSTVDWAPRGREHAVIRKDLPCVPCQNKGCDDSGVSRCLDELTLEEAISVIWAHLERIGP